MVCLLRRSRRGYGLGARRLPRRARDTRRRPTPCRHAPGTLAAARLKVTTTLNATELLAINPTDGKPRVSLRIRLPDRIVTAEIASKSLRKAQTAIHDAEADSIALVLQGRLIAGDVFAQASLSAQPRAAKPPPRSGALEINHWSAAKCVEAPQGRLHTRAEGLWCTPEVYMPYVPKRPSELVPAAPSPSAASAPEGTPQARQLARRFLPNGVLLWAGVAFARTARRRCG